MLSKSLPLVLSIIALVALPGISALPVLVMANEDSAVLAPQNNHVHERIIHERIMHARFGLAAGGWYHRHHTLHPHRWVWRPIEQGRFVGHEHERFDASEGPNYGKAVADERLDPHAHHALLRATSSPVEVTPGGSPVSLKPELADSERRHAFQVPNDARASQFHYADSRGGDRVDDSAHGQHWSSSSFTPERAPHLLPLSFDNSGAVV